MGDLPPVRDLVPHAGPMVLLSEVLRHDVDETACAIDIAGQALFRDEDGSVPAWIALEYMAQCIAVHAGLTGRAEGRPPAAGLLVGARGLRFYSAHFHSGQRLEAVARRLWGSGRGLVSFACAVRDARTSALLAEGRINCFVPPRLGPEDIE
jgi:predicted hotdog family 3-hydroxylacyl-ACP dehydratase